MKKQISREANALADKAYELLLGNSFGAALKGFAPLLDAEIPDISYESVTAKAKACQELIADCDRFIAAGAGHDDQMLLGVVKFKAGIPVQDAIHYWNKFDCEPFFNQITTYLPLIPSIPNSTEENAALKVRLFEGCAKLAEDMLIKTRGQMERQILMGKPLAKIAAEALNVYAYKGPSDCPYTMGEATNFDIAPYSVKAQKAVERLAANCRGLAQLLNGEYYDKAPDEVGLWQFPNGKEYYESCIREHTSLSLTGEEVFELGRTLRKEIEQNMERIRRKQGYYCTREEFSDIIMNDPNWMMTTPEEFGGRLNACVEKILPLMDDYFGIHIVTPCAAVRVSAELEPYYANGIYTPASPLKKNPRGEYHYNGVNVRKKNPLKTEALAYHELIPGHHYQFTVVQETEDLHPFCKAVMVTAYNEGWADYAAAFAGEMGLYSSPLSEYGRLEMDLYITNYLTVDAGLNAMGMTMKEMEHLMAPYLPDYPGPALTRQLMRIAEGFPAFSLAYKLGSIKMQEYRKEAQARLGERFDIRQYHKTVLEWGALPLNLLKKHIDHYIASVLESQVEG